MAINYKMMFINLFSLIPSAGFGVGFILLSYWFYFCFNVLMFFVMIAAGLIFGFGNVINFIESGCEVDCDSGMSRFSNTTTIIIFSIGYIYGYFFTRSALINIK
jgi:hypothetical protein